MVLRVIRAARHPTSDMNEAIKRIEGVMEPLRIIGVMQRGDLEVWETCADGDSMWARNRRPATGHIRQSSRLDPSFPMQGGFRVLGGLFMPGTSVAAHFETGLRKAAARYASPEVPNQPCSLPVRFGRQVVMRRELR